MYKGSTPPGADNPAFEGLDRMGTQEAAAYLGVDTRTIGYHKRAGHIKTAPGSRPNNSLFNKNDLGTLFADYIRKRPNARKPKPARDEVLEALAVRYAPRNRGFQGAFKKGYQAAAAGKSAALNPYPMTPRQTGFRNAWSEGYSARKEQPRDTAHRH